MKGGIDRFFEELDKAIVDMQRFEREKQRQRAELVDMLDTVCADAEQNRDALKQVVGEVA